MPRFALVTVAATLAGFVVTSFAGVNPAWAALGGACLLAGRRLAAHKGSACDGWCGGWRCRFCCSCWGSVWW